MRDSFKVGDLGSYRVYSAYKENCYVSDKNIGRGQGTALDIRLIW